MSIHPPTRDDSPSASRKRPKTQFSCAECRRTKAKCDRVWPCGECRRKDLQDLCPNRVSTNALPKTKTITLLTERIAELEERLRRLGQDVESPLSHASHTPTQSKDAPTRPYDMTAMLGRLAVGPSYTPTTRHAGSEAAPFYLESPEGSDSEDVAAVGLGNDFECAYVPWPSGQRRKTIPWGQIPGSLMDQCRRLLPSQRQARQLWQEFWELTSWRAQPMAPSLFLDHILPSIYKATSVPRLDHLAVYLAVLGAILTLDPSNSVASILPARASSYVELSWSCLMASKLFTDATLECLIAMSILGLCVLNSDDKRTPDSNFAIFGLGLRLAIISGYHRDPALIHPEMDPTEMDARRRIFHELLASDRLHCMPALLPNSIDLHHYDTKLPSDSEAQGYFVWKWTIGVQICRVVDYWTSTRIPPYDVLLDIDAGIRRLFHALPDPLRSPDLPVGAFSFQRRGAPPVSEPQLRQQEDFPTQAGRHTVTATVGSAVRQRIRLAMHFCMLFFYLHRPCFIHSLVASDSSMDLSIHTMAETCHHVVNLTSAVMALDWNLSRWFSFSADLFSVLHCLAVLIVKAPGLNSSHHMSLLIRGCDTLQWTCSLRPNSKNRALLHGAQRLLTNAKTRSQPGSESLSPTQATRPVANATPWPEWLSSEAATLAGLPTTDLSVTGRTVDGFGQDASLESFLNGLWQPQLTTESNVPTIAGIDMTTGVFHTA